MIILNAMELAWAGGLFTGEGCVTKLTRASGIYPRLSIHMTDLPPLERFQRAVGGLGRINGPYTNGKGVGGGDNKLRYVWTVNGFETSQAVLAMIWPWICPRRQARAVEILDEYGAWQYPGEEAA